MLTTQVLLAFAGKSPKRKQTKKELTHPSGLSCSKTSAVSRKVTRTNHHYKTIRKNTRRAIRGWCYHQNQPRLWNLCGRRNQNKSLHTIYTAAKTWTSYVVDNCFIAHASARMLVSTGHLKNSWRHAQDTSNCYLSATKIAKMIAYNHPSNFPTPMNTWDHLKESTRMVVYMQVCLLILVWDSIAFLIKLHLEHLM